MIWKVDANYNRPLKWDFNRWSTFYSISNSPDTAREVVAKITILENKLATTPSKEMMRQVDVLFIELNEILEKFEGDDKELYTKIVGKLKEKFEKIKTQFKAYYDVYQVNVEVESEFLFLPSTVKTQFSCFYVCL